MIGSPRLYRYSCRRPYHRCGMTLLEVILAMGILTMLSGMTYWFYASILETRAEGTATTYNLRLSRVVLDRISQEVRQATTISPDQLSALLGDREHIVLSTLRLPSKELSKNHSLREEPPPVEYDLVKVEYSIVRHPDIQHEDGWDRALGLARIERRIPRSIAPIQVDEDGQEVAPEDLPPDEEMSFDEFFLSDETEDEGSPDLGPDIQWQELYAPEIRYLRFCYYDGHSWWDDWKVSSDNSLPQMVMITIGFEEHPPIDDSMGLDEINEEFCECLGKDPVDCLPLQPDQYSTVVRIAQSDPLFRSRVNRETQAILDEINKGDEDENDDDNGGGE